MTPIRSLRVLIVDDDDDMLVLLDAMLTGESTEVVGLASNGADAVKVASAIAPDVAIVDYMMPGMDGFKTAAAIKDIRPGCRIVIFSALDLHDEATQHAAVDHFLSKSHISELGTLLEQISVEQDRR